MTVRMHSFLKGDIGAPSSSSSSSSSSPPLIGDATTASATSGSETASAGSSSTSTNKKRPRDDEKAAGGGVIDLCNDDDAGTGPAAVDVQAAEAAVEAAMPAYLAAFIPTIRHFHAEVESTFTCKACGFVREPKNEFYRIFSLNLGDDDVPVAGTQSKQQLRLVDLMGSFFAEEERELACDQCCAVGARATAASRMTSTPSVLVVHLKRSRFMRETTSYSKIRCPVQFPASFRLDQEGLRDVLHPEVTHGACGSSSDSERLQLSGSFAETAQLIRHAQAVALAEEEEEAMALEVADDVDVMEIEEGNTTFDAAATTGQDDHQGWSCHQCTLLNEAHHVACQACDAVRPPDDDRDNGITDGGNGMIVGDSPTDGDEEVADVMHDEGEEGDAVGQMFAVASKSAAVIDLTTFGESEGSASDPSDRSSQSQENNQGVIRDNSVPSSSASSSAHGPGVRNNAGSPTDGSPPAAACWQYRLSAVVRHMGNNVFTGHYICDTFTAASAASRVGKALRPGGAWRRCDDSVVMPITEEEVLADQTSPYILFYERERVM